LHKDFINFHKTNRALPFLHAALESISDGFTIWDKELNLLAFNKHYEELYFSKITGLRVGMSLFESCELSIENGNYPNETANDIYIKFKDILDKTAKQNQVQIFEREIKDEIIRSTFINAAGLGQIVTHKNITKEKQLQQTEANNKKELKDQNILFNMAINHMSHGLSMFDKNERLIICNNAYQELYELPNEMVTLGTRFGDILKYRITNGLISKGDSLETFRQRSKEITAAKVNTQTFIEEINGKIINVYRKSMPEGGWVSTQQDISEQSQREETINQRSEEILQQNMRFDAAVNNMSHGLSLFDKNHKLVICNQPYIDMYNLPKKLSQPGTSFWDILDHGALSDTIAIKDQDKRFEILNKIINDAKPIQEPITMLNGKIMFIRHQPLDDGGWLATHEDITEKTQKAEIIKQRSKEILQQNIRFDAAVNNMSHGLAMYDKNYKLIICNKPYTKLYELPKQLCQPGTSFWDIINHCTKNGAVPFSGGQKLQDALNKQINIQEPTKSTVNMLNGRTILIQNQPMQDGGWLSTHEDITEQHKSEKLIRYLARHDGLTGIANRSSFYEELEGSKSLFHNNETISILCIDLDKFKPINDNFGHGAGDAVIKEVANRISKNVGKHGVVARLGGDEFVALIKPTTNKKLAKDIAHNITQAIIEPIIWDGIELNICASIGIASTSDKNFNTQTLIHNSDLALYYAKKETGGHYCFFKEEMDNKRKKRQIIEAGLKQALKNNELRLHYQPLISMKDNKISCCEALMRWENSEGSFSPFEFIPVAEETGLIREMGNWALQEACATAAKWQDNQRIAVNVSPIQFKGNELVAQVADALIMSGLDANRLELEITESLFLANDEHNLKILHDLKSLGVRIALDDFGTGYSSLSYLRSFPFDKIKIDRAFITDLHRKKENIAIVKAITDIANSLNMSTVAEGVETQEELDAVRQQGCNEVQGYLYSPPLPLNEINKMLKTATKEVLLKKSA